MTKSVTPPITGTYLVGRLGECRLRRGYYLYTGSAFGPGGIPARVLRHLRTGKTRRWHIDYLARQTTAAGAWYCTSAARLEHAWAAALTRSGFATPFPGFGSSDCRCPAHLFFSPTPPARETLTEAFEAASGVPAELQPFPGVVPAA